MANEPTINRINSLLDLMNLNSNKNGDIASDDEILKIENSLNVKLPDEFKSYLKAIGFVFCSGLDFLHKNELIDKTQKLRKVYYGGIYPINLVPIAEDLSGNYFSLVCDGVDRGKVIFWQHDAGQWAYPNTSKDKDKNYWIEAPDFWSWLLRLLEEEYECQKKDQQFWAA